METPIPPSSEDNISQTIPMGKPVLMGQALKSTPTSAASVISLVLGILSLVTCCGFLTGVPAFFIGHSELKAMDLAGRQDSNRTLAKIGMILGTIGTILSCLIILASIVLFFVVGSSSDISGQVFTQ